MRTLTATALALITSLALVASSEATKTGEREGGEVSRSAFARAVGAVGALLSAAPGLAGTPGPPAVPPVGIDVAKLRPVYKPHKFTPLEGYKIKAIHWKRWGNSRARGVGRFRMIPPSSVYGYESGRVDVRVTLSGAKACPVYDQSGNVVGEIPVFTRAKLASIGKPYRCAVICTSGSPGYDIGCL